MQTRFIHSLLSTAILIGLSSYSFAAQVPEGTILAELQEVTINNGAEPASLDPHKVEGTPESAVAYQLFEGLVTRNSLGKIEPGVALSWEHSEDFKTWTFHLRENAKWSNGDPVTAKDFVYSWQRLVSPQTASPYSSYLVSLQLKNAQDVINGKKDPKTLGVEAKDDHTFVIHLTNPVPYAVGLVSHNSLLPVHQKTVEKYGDQWVRVENMVGNGAYKLAGHTINEKIEFVRNETYWNNKETVIDKATFLTIPNPTTDVARYRAGDLDMTASSLPPEQFNKLKKEIPNELFITKLLATYSYEINNKKFKDIRVRKALNLALNRKIITDKVLGQGQTPTYVFTPTYIEEGDQIQQPAYSKESMKDRNAQAIALLKEAGYSKATPLQFTILYNTSDSHKKVAIAAASIWKQNTKGLVKIKLKNQEWKTFLETRRQGNFDVSRSGWTGDYNQATTFGTYYLSNSSNNRISYKSKIYDDAINSAYNVESAEDRANAYAKAEAQLANDYATVPVYNYVSVRLVKPYLKGYSGKDPLDHVFLKNLYITKH